MCKATWIPKTQQTAAAFELRLFKTSQWSPSNGKVGREILLFRGWWKTLSMWRKDRAFTCSYLRTENAHSSSPWAMTEGQTAKQVCSPSQKRMARVPQPTPGAASRRHQAGSSQLWEWCQPGPSENPSSAKQGLPPPLWWEAFNSDPFSAWCKRSSSLYFITCILKKPCRINNFYCNFQLRCALVKPD